MKMEADEVLLEFIHAELVSYAYNKAVSSNESAKKVCAAVATYGLVRFEI